MSLILLPTMSRAMRAGAVLMGLTVTLGLATASDALAQEPTAEELLVAIDKNMKSDSQSSNMAMTVTTTRRTRTYEMKSISRGDDDSAVEYLAPTRDKGTKMLKLKDQIWMYMPAIEREQQISGHMLRQGMMGSDMSYEDLLSATDFGSQYTAKIVGSEDVNGRPSYKVEMTARDESVTYPRRLAWIDKEQQLPVKQELYALSGMLVKTWDMRDIKQFDSGRYYPMKMVIADKVQEGTSTTIAFSDLKFGVEVVDEVFSRRWLSRK